VVAIDLPTGLGADSAEVAGPAVSATLTVTLGAPKAALVLPPAERHSGSLVIADIGIPQSVIESLDGPWLELITKSRMAALVTPRVPESQKGDYGRILLVAGSRGKTGAAHLAAAGALRSGAGLVTVATPASCQPILATLGVEYMTEALEETSDGQVAWEALDRILDADADVIALGPGLGRAPSTMALVQAVVERAGVPLVLDADALFAFVAESDRLLGRDDAEIIITPHPGEMARLTGLTVEAVQANRVEVARTFATTHRVHVILKGHRTVVATPDGRQRASCRAGCGCQSGPPPCQTAARSACRGTAGIRTRPAPVPTRWIPG
jgi:NAD(P)H-hydrate epimerase